MGRMELLIQVAIQYINGMCHITYDKFKRSFSHSLSLFPSSLLHLSFPSFTLLFTSLYTPAICLFVCQFSLGLSAKICHCLYWFTDSVHSNLITIGLLLTTRETSTRMLYWTFIKVCLVLDNFPMLIQISVTRYT